MNVPDVVVPKWSRNVLNEGFVPFPKKLIRCLGKVFSGEHAIDKLAVVLAIVDYKRPRLARPPSLEFLAFTAGIDVEDFRSYVEELAKNGLIEVAGTDADFHVEISGLLKEILNLAPDED